MRRHLHVSNATFETATNTRTVLMKVHINLWTCGRVEGTLAIASAKTPPTYRSGLQRMQNMELENPYWTCWASIYTTYADGCLQKLSAISFAKTAAQLSKCTPAERSMCLKHLHNSDHSQVVQDVPRGHYNSTTKRTHLHCFSTTSGSSQYCCSVCLNMGHKTPKN